MRVRFTKMQGAGNDFVVLDATGAPLALTPPQRRHLADRRFGVGADQLLLLEPAHGGGVDFGYRVFNGASGDEVEHCGNGARCVARYLLDRGRAAGDVVRVRTVNRVLTLRIGADGWPVVDMGEPVFDPARVPFDTAGLVARCEGALDWWTLDGVEPAGAASGRAAGDSASGATSGATGGATVHRTGHATVHRTGHATGHATGDAAGRAAGVAGDVTLAVASMGNPHAVLSVDDVDSAPVTTLGPRIEHHRRFAARTNVGFVQIVARDAVRLRVWERDAGETLACGTGACAAVAVGIRAGRLDAVVRVQARGGLLRIEWPGPGHALALAGPAETVFEGEIEL